MDNANETRNDAERINRYIAAGYTHLLVYTEQHNEYGTGEDILPFTSEESARDWVRGINAKWEAGNLSYRVPLYYIRDLRPVPEKMEFTVLPD